MRDLLQSLEKRYGNNVRISVVDPRNPLILWYSIRYGAWATFSTWILNGKKIFEGIPKFEELKRLIDSELNK